MCYDTNIVTHIQKLRNEERAQMLEVLQELGWSEEHYGNFKLDMGIAYLENYLDGDRYMIDAFKASRAFWNWWRLQWISRERDYLDSREGLGRAYECEVYCEVHSPAFLLNDLEPSGAVMEDAYAVMVGEVIKEAKEKVL